MAGTSQAADNGVMNGQVQFGDVFSNQTLNVEESSEGVSADALAVGNIVAATGQNAQLNFTSDQAVGAHVEATANVAVAGASGPYFATTASATGNSATAGTCCALTYGSSIQSVESGAVVAGDAISSAGGPAGSISVDASAVGNTTGWQQINGEVQAWTGQNNQGLTTASNTGAFASTTGNAGFSATAVSNNVTVDNDGGGGDIGVQQNMEGVATDAVINVQLDSGTDIQGLATSVGNNIDAQSASPDAQMNAAQHNAAPVNAYANLTAGTWSGDANVTAYGVGNSVVQSNNGPRAGLWNEQTSAGEVAATASFTGGTGSTVFASSTAIGNAASGYACSACGGALDATNSQTGSSRVRANSNVVIRGRARQVAAQATAIGNSATYAVSGGDR